MRAFSKAAPSATATTRAKHTLPQLPYSYDALEPAISAEIMELHHSKHHQTYVNGLNAAEEQIKSAVENGDAKKVIELQNAFKFNGGGVLRFLSLPPERPAWFDQAESPLRARS
jgi:Fe-Mn family superoxide dismutase